MVVEFWLSKAGSFTLRKNAQYNLGFACFFLDQFRSIFRRCAVASVSLPLLLLAGISWFKSRSKSTSHCLGDHRLSVLSEIQHAAGSDPHCHGSVLSSFKDPSLKVSPCPVQGIWRIPVDEIDRPGSFASHMNRSIVLLLNVLAQLKDYNTLLKVSSMLQRTPDQGKYERFLPSHGFVKLWVCFVRRVTVLFKAVLCLGKKTFRQVPLGIERNDG